MPGRTYIFRIGTQSVSGSITTIKYSIDVNTRKHLAATTLDLNEIGFCNLATAFPVPSIPTRPTARPARSSSSIVTPTGPSGPA